MVHEICRSALSSRLPQQTAILMEGNYIRKDEVPIVFKDSQGLLYIRDISIVTKDILLNGETTVLCPAPAESVGL